MRVSISIQIIIAVLVLVGANSCDPHKNNLGEYKLSSSNVKGDVWIKSSFPDFFKNEETIDSSVISIRVSRKVVMKGFNKMGDTTNGAFAKLLEVFSGFKSPHNPNAKVEYRFFDGDNSGKISPQVTASDLFNPNQYTSKSNNLHFQFKNIADEITIDTSKSKFYVIFSDGETTIRKEQNDNTDEMVVIKDAIKNILQKNSTIQVGILSLIANFNGEYVYDINKSENLKCKRYLYAICFFDKKFLPEFNRFCQLNKNLGGNNFLFNPQLSLADYTPIYITDKIDGQPNVASASFYSAYPVDMTGQDISYEYKNGVKLSYISMPVRLRRSTYSYSQIDTFLFGKPILLDSSISELNSNQVLNIKKLQNSCIIKIDMAVDYNMPVDSIVIANLLSQDIHDNRENEMKLIKDSESLSILRTEGLRDMFEMILQALQESKQSVLLSNFIQLGKD